MPEILIDFPISKTTIHIFDKTQQEVKDMLDSVSSIYDVRFEVTTIIEGWMRVDVSSKKFGDISKFIDSLKKLIPKNIIPKSDIITHIIETLEKENKKITFAESCTGGLLSYYFTSHNGASKILDGSLVTYSNSLKENWIAVAESIIEKNGAVSYEVVREMSEGAMSVSNADYALAVSGIAGDSGGSIEKPVGTVYVGVRTNKVHQIYAMMQSGQRESGMITMNQRLAELVRMGVISRETAIHSSPNRDELQRYLGGLY